MSSILKALKKIEKEKGREHQGRPALSVEILREDLSRRRKIPFRLPLFFLGLIALGSAAGMLLMRTEQVPSIAVPTADAIKAQAVETPPVAASADPVPALSTQEDSVSSVSAPQGVEPTAASLEALSVPAQYRAPVAALTVAANPVQESMAVAVTPAVVPVRVPKAALKKASAESQSAALVESSSVTPEPLNPLPISAPVSVGSRSSYRPLVEPVVVPSRSVGWLVREASELKDFDLRVSEIHWRPVAKERLAVVNDLPVLEGVDIEGARVDRIFKDRIRFVVNGRYLEVKLAPPATP